MEEGWRTWEYKGLQLGLKCVLQNTGAERDGGEDTEKRADHCRVINIIFRLFGSFLFHTLCLKQSLVVHHQYIIDIEYFVS